MSKMIDTASQKHNNIMCPLFQKKKITPMPVKGIAAPTGLNAFY
jgi:hypothetical protein